MKSPNQCTTLEDIPDWLQRQYERGYHPMDEPPGFEEMYYHKWKELGGQVIPPKPVTVDDL